MFAPNQEIVENYEEEFFPQQVRKNRLDNSVWIISDLQSTIAGRAFADGSSGFPKSRPRDYLDTSFG